VEGSVVCERLNAALPAGIHVFHVEEIEDKAPAVQTQVLYSDYEVTVRGPVDILVLQQRVDALLAAQTLPRQRRDRQYDLRPLIELLAVRAPNGAQIAVLEMRLKAQEAATGRPDEVLLALEIARERARIERTTLHFKARPAPTAPTED
jgi:hypothetical protein